ncbi:PREDICTED: uncharacterized protein LOC104609781 isoform X2 [Nelumbo nucifera]|uniref:Uncharacterized protein n=2 Tax=Nelumbo nucifera TaxID=4432 RepID=A0A822XQK4_NELNU|nr:PREDICTED: uncharacterized protein LOC104609781 isoform X2 [Nelumbo nucifera]DAD21226.1 TPA_asm: hypothetical protein HUJ06_022689 [Nelumbo nucifera]
MGSRSRGTTAPSLEHLWRDEVLYLHSLWHQGPPRTPNADSNPKPTSSTNNALRANNPTAFKQSSKKKRRKKKKKNKESRSKEKKDSNPPVAVPDVAWPVEPAPEPLQETGWPDLNPQSVPTTRPASEEEQAKLGALQLQQKGLKACQDFFLSNAGSDDEGEDDEDLMDVGEEESQEFQFFLGVFTEDGELRNYYEKNWEGGEFCCLVCGGIGKKVGKRFKNCVALVQHSTGIAKTKKKRAHRAFGQAICRVLGWDIHRLPSIVLSVGQPLGQWLTNSSSEMGTKENDTSEEILQDQVAGTVNDDNSKWGPSENDKSGIRNTLQGSNEPKGFQVDLKEDDANHEKDGFHSELMDNNGEDQGEEMDSTVR